MVSIDYTNSTFFMIMLIFYIVMNIIAIVKKKAGYTMVTVLLSTAIFVLHVISNNRFTPEILKQNVLVDFASLAVSIPILLVIDEVETRRSVIKNVFHQKYDKK